MTYTTIDYDDPLILLGRSYLTLDKMLELVVMGLMTQIMMTWSSNRIRPANIWSDGLMKISENLFVLKMVPQCMYRVIIFSLMRCFRKRVELSKSTSSGT